MTCEEFQELLADRLGNEPVSTNQVEFDRHAAACVTCRRDFESARSALEAMRSLSVPPSVSVRREESRLIFESQAQGGSRSAWRRHRTWLGQAAGLFIAFVAGYGLHGWARSDAGGERRGPVVIRTKPFDILGKTDGSFDRALAEAHSRKPSRSGLAKCMIALVQPRS